MDPQGDRLKARQHRSGEKNEAQGRDFLCRVAALGSRDAAGILGA